MIPRPRRWERVGGEHGRLLLPPRVHEVAREIRFALAEALPQTLPGGAARGGAAPSATRRQGRKYIGFGILNVASEKPPLRSLNWSPKLATMS